MTHIGVRDTYIATNEKRDIRIHCSIAFAKLYVTTGQLMTSACVQWTQNSFTATTLSVLHEKPHQQPEVFISYRLASWSVTIKSHTMFGKITVSCYTISR